jgi:hypothetical protein
MTLIYLESLVGLAYKRPQLTLHFRTLNFTFFQIMLLCAMFFGSFKNLLFCVTCHRVRAIKSYFPAFQFVHIRVIGKLL